MEPYYSTSTTESTTTTIQYYSTSTTQPTATIYCTNTTATVRSTHCHSDYFWQNMKTLKTSLSSSSPFDQARGSILGMPVKIWDPKEQWTIMQFLFFIQPIMQLIHIQRCWNLFIYFFTQWLDQLTSAYTQPNSLSLVIQRQHLIYSAVLTVAGT